MWHGPVLEPGLFLHVLLWQASGLCASAISSITWETRTLPLFVVMSLGK